MAEDQIGQELGMRVMREGASAARAGDPITASPYDRASEDVTERAKAHAWRRGWGTTRLQMNREHAKSV